MSDLFSEVGIHSKGAHVLLMDTNVVFLKPLFEKSDREKGAWEVWGINEECPKCHFEHLIGMITYSWYTEPALGLGHERVLGLLQFA